MSKITLFGETHGLLDELPKIRALINDLQPELILYEMLEETQLFTAEEIEIFLKNEPKDDFSIISKYEELFPTVHLAKEFNIPIIGCDYKDMLRKNKDFLKKESFDEEEKEIMEKREKKQLETINKHSDKKLLVLVGLYHLRKESILRTINSTIITPRIDGKELEETIDGELTYVEEQV